MKKILARLTALMLLIIWILTLSACKVETNNKIVSFEVKGYESADEAALSYVKSFCQSDIDSMLSTFAIETFIENYDLKEFINSRKYYDYYNTECPFENNSDFKMQINYYSRISELVKSFKQTYYYLILKDDNFSAIETFTRSNANDIELFVNKISDPYFDEKISSAKIRRVLTPEFFNDLDLLTYKNTTTTKYSYLNCDEIKSFAVELDFDGDEYYLFVDVGLFDNVWYNISISSSLGISVGADGSFSIMYR